MHKDNWLQTAAYLGNYKYDWERQKTFLSDLGIEIAKIPAATELETEFVRDLPALGAVGSFEAMVAARESDAQADDEIAAIKYVSAIVAGSVLGFDALPPPIEEALQDGGESRTYSFSPR